MIDQVIPPAVAEQARLDLSLAASATERANRPRGPLYIALALLVVAGIYALAGISARQSSMSAVAKARRQSNEIIALVNEVKSFQKALAERGLDPNPHIGAQLEQLAGYSGLHLSSPVADTPAPETAVAGMSPKGYRARFDNQDPGALLQFLNATIDAPEVAGVGIRNLELTPGAPDPTTGQVNWNLSVDFIRWERAFKR